MSTWFLSLALLLGPPTVLSEEAKSPGAVFSWSGQGQLFQTGTNSVEFMGVIQGVLYLWEPGGSLDEAFMECSVRNRLSLQEETTQADGNCLIVQSPEDNAYASFDCSGEFGVCSGNLVFTSGTGRFEGISGGAGMFLRSPLRLLAPTLAGGEELTVDNGIVLFTDIEYETE